MIQVTTVASFDNEEYPYLEGYDYAQLTLLPVERVVRLRGYNIGQDAGSGYHFYLYTGGTGDEYKALLREVVEMAAVVFHLFPTEAELLVYALDRIREIIYEQELHSDIGDG